MVDEWHPFLLYCDGLFQKRQLGLMFQQTSHHIDALPFLGYSKLVGYPTAFSPPFASFMKDFFDCDMTTLKIIGQHSSCHCRVKLNGVDDATPIDLSQLPRSWLIIQIQIAMTKLGEPSSSCTFVYSFNALGTVDVFGSLWSVVTKLELNFNNFQTSVMDIFILIQTTSNYI